MKIYDISQEVFGCSVFPGDPAPERTVLMRISEGDICNLSRLSMCAHNGTHIDAPYHFIDEGKRVHQLALDTLVGRCYVAEKQGELTAEDARCILTKAAAFPDSDKRILIAGKAVVTEEAAHVFADHGVRLVGNESQTVGPEDGPAAVHRILLGADMILLEGIRLAEVPEGSYLLSAAPLNLGDADGAPCRAVLIDEL